MYRCAEAHGHGVTAHTPMYHQRGYNHGTNGLRRSTTTRGHKLCNTPKRFSEHL